MRVLLLALLNLTIQAATSQQVWVVDKLSRPGTDFTDLPAAVSAAAQGDVLRVRYTSTNFADWYTAPTIVGKGLSIVGDSGAKPIVYGAWTISAMPSNQRMVVAHIELRGAGFFDPLNFVVRSCLGPVLLDDVMPGGGTVAPSPSSFVDQGMKFVDSRLVLIARSRIDWYGGIWVERSTLGLSDSSVRNVSDGGLTAGGPGIRLENARLAMARSSIYGGDQPPVAQDPNGAAGDAIIGNDAIVVIGGGCTLSGGRNRNGTVGAAIIYGYGFVDAYVDPTNTVAIGGYFGGSLVRYHTGPQSGLAFSQEGTTLHVDQFAHAGGITALAIGGHAATPWSSSVVGPVYVDPGNFVSYLDLSVADMQMRRSFAIPPGLPPGTAVTMQAFELLPSGTYLTSNAVVAGVW